MHLIRIYCLSASLLITACSLANASHVTSKGDSKIHRVKLVHSKHQGLKRDDFPPPESTNSRQSNAKSHLTNKQLLSKLGLSKIRIPPSHNRKRLAVESRHHTRPDDSHMFIIKLPPNGAYYSFTKSADTKNSVSDSGKQVSFKYQSNGKPGRIYHWNIPVLKKIASDGSRMPTFRHNQDVSDLIDIKRIPTWSKPWENETIEKTYGKIRSAEKKSLKKKSPTYYAPENIQKNKFHKYFPGNGKPKGFYVIKKSRKPGYYKELLP